MTVCPAITVSNAIRLSTWKPGWVAFTFYAATDGSVIAISDNGTPLSQEEPS